MILPRPGWPPPKRTARWLSILVSVKAEQGGGLVPLTVGENQTPAGAYTSMCVHSMNLTITTLTDVKDMDLIGGSSPISEPGVIDE